MLPAERLDPKQLVSRAVIYPTHLPQSSLAPEHLLKFQRVTDDDSLGGWDEVFAFSVNIVPTSTTNLLHIKGLELAVFQNKTKPLKASKQFEAFGNMKHYMGYYVFKTGDLPPRKDTLEEIVNIYMPNNMNDLHSHCCARFSGNACERTERTTRLLKIVTEIWKILSGPQLYCYPEEYEFSEAVNSISIDKLP